MKDYSHDPAAEMKMKWLSVSMPRSSDDVEAEINSLNPRRYRRKLFEIPAPQLVDLEEDLSREADEKIRTLAFWRSYRLKNAYVKEHIGDRYRTCYEDWDKQRREFNANEDGCERAKNAKYDHEYAEQVAKLRSCLAGEDDCVQECIDRVVAGLDVPFSSDLALDVHRDSAELIIFKLYLPSIESFPKNGPVALKSGAIKIKPKTQKRLREEYATYLFSLVLYVSARLMDASPMVSRVVGSAYAKRMNKEDSLVDECLFSGIFEREAVCTALSDRTDAEEFCLSITHHCNMTKTKIFKAVKPLQ